MFDVVPQKSEFQGHSAVDAQFYWELGEERKSSLKKSDIIPEKWEISENSNALSDINDLKPT